MNWSSDDEMDSESDLDSLDPDQVLHNTFDWVFLPEM